MSKTKTAADIAQQHEPYAVEQTSTPEGEAAFVAGYHGARGIDMPRWARRLSTTPIQAARFLSGKNPDGEKTKFGDALQDDASVSLLAGDFEDEAAANPAVRRMLDWVQVARKRQIAIDDGMASIATAHAPGQDSAAPELQHHPKAPPEWQELAQRRAREIIARQAAKDLFPSLNNVADEIAREFRRDGIVGAGGKPLTGSSIKRRALQGTGISSAKGRQLSTSPRRGK